MADQSPVIKSEGGSCWIFNIFIFFFVLFVVFVGISYHFGSDDVHPDVPHALSAVFQSTEQLDLIKKLGKKAHKWAIVKGTAENGLYDFIEYYADYRAAKGKMVIMRKQVKNRYETIFNFMRTSKDFLEENLDIEPDQDKTEWVFLVKDGQVPLEEIQAIKTRHSKDRITIGVVQDLEIEGFKNVDYPGLTLEQLEAVMAQEFEITPEEVKLLSRYHGNDIHRILTNFDKISYSHQQYLGDNYVDLSEYKAADALVLEKLCETGTVKLQKGNADNLDSAGVLVHKKTCYWKDRINRLNYELQKGVECAEISVPQSVLDEIEAESNAEQKEVKVEVKTKAKKTGEKKKTAKKI